MPESYLPWAIVATASGCFPLGIYAIIQANKVDTYYFAGQYAEAERAADSAKAWSIAGIVFSVVLWILLFVISFLIEFYSEFN